MYFGKCEVEGGFMINRILDLIKINKINASKLTSEAGLTTSSISDWKSGKSKPSTEAVAKIANYFGVSTDFIILGQENESTLSENEKELLKLFRELKTEKQQDKFLGKAELIIQDMINQDTKKDTGNTSA